MKNVGRRDGKIQRIRELTVRLCLLLISEATLIKSHQQDCPNMNGTRVTPTNMPDWWGEGLTPTRNYRQLRKAGGGKSTPADCTVPSGQL